MSITKKDYLAFKTKVEKELLPLLIKVLQGLNDPKELPFWLRQTQQDLSDPKEKAVYQLTGDMRSITPLIVSKINEKLGTTNSVMKVIEEKKDSCESIIQTWTEILKKEKKAMKTREVRIKELEDDHIVPD